jgi:hypothetical protein
MRRLLEDPLAEELLKGGFTNNPNIIVDRDGERLIFKEAPAEAGAPVQE